MVKEFTKGEWEELLVSKIAPDEGRLVAEGEPTEEFVAPPTPSERLVVVEKVVHISKATNTTSYDSNFERVITADEEPWHRERSKIGPEWKKIDLGWFTIDKVGILLIRHRGTRFEVRPTPEQQQEADSKIVDVSFDGVRPDLELPPLESQRLNILHGEIFLRCRNGDAELSLTILPR